MSLKKIINKFLDFLFPRRCTICDKIIGDDKGVCKECEKKISVLSGTVCIKCGKRVAESDLYCFDCSRKHHFFVRNFAVFEYPIIRESLYRFKYKGRAEYAAYYAKKALELHGDRLRLLDADAIVPIPLHFARQQKRGYNQAYEFAKEVSKRIQVPVTTHLIKRVKATKPMKLMDVSGRQNNLKKAFLIIQNDVKLKTIILVDDIYTTGSTMDAVAKICMDVGIERIYCLTIAVGDGL